ncbi:MAG: hypothetical protein NDI94_06525 [Candidatus Woesearchaeota archaeon]|jgi:Mn-dependent DtxR family transcriptional regulator|nr:hypothetical protein [Candidatus Woesearchaeota archaeon]
MGQQEVYDFLKKNKTRWWSSKDIAEKLDASIGSVTTTLTKLRKRNDVKFVMSKEKTNMYLYRFKV